MVKITFNPNIIQDFKCPNCELYMLPPIYQCKKGHNQCDECFGKLKKCHECSECKSDERSYVLEEIAEYLEFPCKFKEKGCDFKSYYDNVNVHQNVCSFRENKTTKSKENKPNTKIKQPPTDSKSDSKGYMKVNPLFLEENKCPLCNYYIDNFVYYCTNGHQVCLYCVEITKICYICLAPVCTDTSNFKCDSTLEYPCKFQNLGCKFQGHFRDVLEHQMDCDCNAYSDSDTTLTANIGYSVFNTEDDSDFVIRDFFKTCL
ncbi:unnamed protein product [Brassicogethes aeneus]|uniref:E3 ubiquitin-protein ligase Sina-like RING finger domain-containing protein n=1 Tax=Brassicogethes aeneus TaxID=1431903 RepID=A0A9P0FN04_BRAAE|nr:unnamed protein product [Brassicogethes aeneus]